MRNKSLTDRIADTFGWSIGISLLAMMLAGVAANYTRPTVQIMLGGTKFTLEVANTPATQSRGLMKRTARQLKTGGMIFPVEPRRNVAVWMKDMLVPLDLVFIRQGKIVKIMHQVPPCQADFSCSPIASPVQVDAVIELLGGTAQNLGLKEGMKLDLPIN
ncbi:DUF192 domain-containing protein [Planktothrix sp. FACHB-1355]|uniref:DUF192 domain-containing protein n=1 Tax=Aerosakkonema funiforme FACHB-1375 TaxID=2949571 RepID=A0A926VFK6_9CYAN|nr:MULTISPECIES: DUF192 domain-containing protein [Oscillatoriales]MBD2181842.1 DUF192 domain-containing protein [Aerosakkonema funiforme FACHB-1375]MBD3557262.1 DUF192 domain-containing protein [Planktothrix sp. FACHB-1355]